MDSFHYVNLWLWSVNGMCCCLLQEVFHERIKMYKAWKDEEVALTKKREAKVKMELAHKTDKLSAVTHEITEVSWPQPNKARQYAPHRWQFDGGISFRRQSGHLRQSMDPKIVVVLRLSAGRTSLVAGNG